MKIQINNAAPVQCTKKIFIAAQPEIVWNILTDIHNWSKWQTDISNVSIENSMAPGTNFKWKTGGAKINSTLHTVLPYKAFGWTGKTIGLLAIHNWKLEQDNDGTLLSVEESMQGLLAIVFKKSFNSNLEKGMLHWLGLLKKECEK
ncbi:MAG: SRPBCC family protein [Flavobacterium sp.]|nr:SRPBCC family protein [Flavobacterium sp.]